MQVIVGITSLWIVLFSVMKADGKEGETSGKRFAVLIKLVFLLVNKLFFWNERRIMNKAALIKGLAVFTILMMVSGSALAWDRDAHVKLAPNGKGDLIIYPMYFAANGGWQTKLTVVNTDTQYSVIAKIIFRSYYYSEELLDFILYLTPGDVWTGYLKDDGNGTYVYSEDDSTLAAAGVFASAANPLRQPLFAPKCTAVPPYDSANIGYVEVIETWYGIANNYRDIIAATAAERTTPPVSKTYLKRVYDNATAKLRPGYTGGAGWAGQWADDDFTINVLAANMSFLNASISGYTGDMRAVVFADWDTDRPLDATNMSGIVDTAVHNTLGELEAVLAKNNIAMEYVNKPATGDLTAHIFTFPTKISNFNKTAGDANFCRYINGRGPYWVDPAPVNGLARTGYACQAYSRTVYDMSENANVVDPFVSGGTSGDAMCREVNILDTSGYLTLFSEGWTLYQMLYTDRLTNNPTQIQVARDPGGTLDYTYWGTPVIPSIVTFSRGGIGLMEGAYTPGEVHANIAGQVNTYTDTTNTRLWNYQYFNVLPTMGNNEDTANPGAANYLTIGTQSAQASSLLLPPPAGTCP